MVGLAWIVTGGMGEPTADDDFTATTGMVSFVALSTTTRITVGTDDDEVVEPVESFSVTISEPVGGLPDSVSIDTDGASADGSISNNDTATITIADGSAEEGLHVAFTITLSAPVSEAVND